MNEERRTKNQERRTKNQEPRTKNQEPFRSLHVHRLGLVPYAAGLELQARLVEQRKAGEIPDQLIFLEHPAVITLGVRSRNERSHILETPAGLAAQGVELFETGRGGDVTYHGPGQLVGYPILDLRPDRCDVHRYVRDLEEALIRAVAAFGVTVGRSPGLTGVWDGEDKLAAIGVRIARWVTSHGFALNVTTNLQHFRLIVPCGISGKGVTSLERLTNRPPAMADVQAAVIQAFAAVFDRQIVDRSAGEPSVAFSQ
jgi:lipoyl(octanoyl) transferase